MKKEINVDFNKDKDILLAVIRNVSYDDTVMATIPGWFPPHSAVMFLNKICYKLTAVLSDGEKFEYKVYQLMNDVEQAKYEELLRGFKGYLQGALSLYIDFQHLMTKYRDEVGSDSVYIGLDSMKHSMSSEAITETLTLLKTIISPLITDTDLEFVYAYGFIPSEFKQILEFYNVK